MRLAGTVRRDGFRASMSQDALLLHVALKHKRRAARWRVSGMWRIVKRCVSGALAYSVLIRRLASWRPLIMNNSGVYWLAVADGCAKTPLWRCAGDNVDVRADRRTLVDHLSPRACEFYTGDVAILSERLMSVTKSQPQPIFTAYLALPTRALYTGSQMSLRGDASCFSRCTAISVFWIMNLCIRTLVDVLAKPRILKILHAASPQPVLQVATHALW